jgi:hypothetical protein
MASEPLSAVIPVLIAAVVCDAGVKERAGGKVSLIGIFDRVFSLAFPAVRPMTLYFKFADAQGHYKFSVRFVQLSGGSTIAEGLAEGDITDRLSSSDALMDFPPLLMPEPGRYEFQIFANEVFLGSAFIDAAVRTNPA